MRFSTTAVLASLAASTLACSPAKNFQMTFYGYPDNSPPGPAVRFSCGGRGGKAGGVGTYAEPLTMATEMGRFAQCEIVYSPYLQKYLRNEDSCANCHGDWVDVWLGSTTSNGGSALMSCQKTLTGANKADRTIITNPPADLPVSAAELFDGSCHSALTNAAADLAASCVGTGTTTVPDVSVPEVPVVPSAPAVPAVSSVPAVPSSTPSSRIMRPHMRVWGPHGRD